MTGLDDVAERGWSLGRGLLAAMGAGFAAFSRWRRHAETIRQLSRLSDRQLDDIGLSRDSLDDTVRRMVLRR